MIQQLITFILLVFLTSCSGVSVLNKDKGKNSQSSSSNKEESFGVDYSDPSKGELPRIKTEETVDILDGKLYVEQKELRDSEEQKSTKKLKIALILGPGLNRSVGHISILRALDRNGIKPEFISGSEMGAIIGAMYASGMTPEMIEWNFYKYFREKSSAVVLSNKWFEDIDEFFLKRFQNVRVENLKRKFFIPLYSKKEKKVVHFNKGNLRNLLLLNLKNIRQSGKAEYTSAAEFEIFNARFAKTQGADVVVGIDVLGGKVSLRESNEYVFGVYNRFIGNITKNRRLVDLYFAIPLEKSNLDSDDSAGIDLQNALDYSDKIVIELQKRREAKSTNEECGTGCI